MTESDQGSARRGFGTTEQGPRSREATDHQRSGENGVKATGDSGPRSTSPTRSKSGARSASSAKGAPRRRPRKAHLRLVQVDAWSVMKTAFLLSIAIGIVTVVAVGIVWSVLGAAGVWDSLNGTVQTVMGNSFRVQDYIGTGRVLGFTMLVAVADVVLLTAIATLGAFLYNLAATLLGGIEVTLAEDS